MGLLDFFARKMGVDEAVEGVEESMAADAGTPVGLLWNLAEKEPRLRPIVRENPSCPADLRAWIDANT